MVNWLVPVRGYQPLDPKLERTITLSEGARLLTVQPYRHFEASRLITIVARFRPFP